MEKVEITRASEVKVREIEWLWYPYIPFGKITVVQGDAGDGKSTSVVRERENTAEKGQERHSEKTAAHRKKRAWGKWYCLNKQRIGGYKSPQYHLSGSALKPRSLKFRKDDRLMRNRDKKARIHFTEEEIRDLDRKAAAAGLDRSKYVRNKVLATEVEPGPQVDLLALIDVTHQAGLKMEAVLFRANCGRLDVLALRRALAEVEQAAEAVRNAFEEDCANELHH